MADWKQRLLQEEAQVTASTVLKQKNHIYVCTAMSVLAAVLILVLLRPPMVSYVDPKSKQEHLRTMNVVLWALVVGIIVYACCCL